MIIRVVAISLAIGCSLAACASSGEPPPGPAVVVPGEEPPAPVVAYIPPTQAMIDAARSGDPDRMRDSIALLSCQSPSSCPPEFGSCAGWSSGSECDATCDFSPICRCAAPEQDGAVGGDDGGPKLRECGPEDTEFRLRRTFESFRVCFNAAQEGCTEWRQTFSSSCNC